jgi:cytochrome c
MKQWLATPLSIVAACAAFLGMQAHAQEKLSGEKLFRSHCMACHTAEHGAPNRMGANLYGVVGRRAGEVAGATYSPAFRKALEGKEWTEPLLDKWLEDPQEIAPDSMMAYTQSDPEKRQAIIGYLKTLR